MERSPGLGDSRLFCTSSHTFNLFKFVYKKRSLYFYEGFPKHSGPKKNKGTRTKDSPNSKTLFPLSFPLYILLLYFSRQKVILVRECRTQSKC